MNRYRKENGITLVTLVVTTIILLILAGITIGQLTKNGLFNKTKSSRDESIKAMAEEEINLIISEVQIDKLGKATLQDVFEKLEKDEENQYLVKTESKYASLADGSITKVGETKVIYITNLEYGCEVKVTSDFEIAATSENDIPFEDKDKVISDLRERISQLEKDIEEKNKIVAEKDDSIADLKNQLATFSSEKSKIYPIKNIATTSYVNASTKGEYSSLIFDSGVVNTGYKNVKMLSVSGFGAELHPVGGRKFGLLFRL